MSEPSLTLLLTPDLQRLLDEQVASGRYDSAEAVVRAALGLLTAEGGAGGELAALRGSEARLRTLGDNLPFAMIYQVAIPADGQGRRILHVSKACERLTGVTPEEAMANPAALYGLVAPEERERVWMASARAVATRTPFDIECRCILPGGEVRWFRLASAPRDTEDGGTLWDGIQIDITEQRKAEEARALLMREVDHRARNALTIVQSIVELTPVEQPQAYKAVVFGRVAALARAQGLLAGQHWEGGDLGQVVTAEVAAIAGPERWTAEGPAVALAPEQVQPLAMLIHELTTNAIKHGALSTAEGGLAIAWRVEEGQVRLDWLERGAAVRPPAPERMGFGTRLIQQLARQLGATVDKRWGESGLECRLAMRLGKAEGTGADLLGD